MDPHTMHDDIQGLIEQCRGLVSDLPELWQTWRTGQRPAGEVLAPIYARVKIIVGVVGDVCPDLADRKERERIVVRVITGILDASGLDIPLVPDDYAVRIMVRAAIWTWRLARQMRRAGAVAE